MDAAPAPTGGAAPFGGQEADLFNAMLGQMMGDDGVSLESGTGVGDDGDALPEEDRDATDAIDPAELVNPMFVDGVSSVTIAPAATFVWTFPIEPTAKPPQASLDLPAGIPALDAADMASPLDLPQATELPFDTSALDAARDEMARTPAPRLQAAEATADAATLASAIELPAAGNIDAPGQQDRSEVAQQISNAIDKADKNDRPSRSAKQEKAPVETKIDAAGIRPVPYVAVERAYAGNEQQSSKSFDAPREQAPLSSAPAAGQPSSVPAFVVPTEGRSMLNTLATTALHAVDTPATMARDIDTHVPAQIVQSIRLQAINGGGEAIIRLNPDYLGEVVVAVKVEQGSVTASLQAETPAVRQWAERNESVLRQALAEQGLQLEKLTVAEKSSETEREAAREDGREEPREEEQSRRQPQRRRPQSDEATFEVTV